MTLLYLNEKVYNMIRKSWKSAKATRKNLQFRLLININRGIMINFHRSWFMTLLYLNVKIYNMIRKSRKSAKATRKNSQFRLSINHNNGILISFHRSWLYYTYLKKFIIRSGNLENPPKPLWKNHNFDY